MKIVITGGIIIGKKEGHYKDLTWLSRTEPYMISTASNMGGSSNL